MAFTWTDDLRTGNGLIDQEHKQLIQAINELLDACAQGKGRTEVVRTMQFLQDYTAKHFADEEKLQLQSRYPDYVNHKRYHEAFKQTVRELAQELEREGPTIVLVGKLNTSVGGWLLNHIKREDVKVAAHIRAQNGI